MNWYEQLPKQCPPIDAMPSQGTYYRIVSGVPTETRDYFSQRHLHPEKMFIGEGIDECIVRSVSLFDNKEAAVRRLRLPKFRNQKVAVVHLNPKDGVMKKTFGPSHYSWWRSTEFNYSKAELA